ncbi:alpha/beta hydrolase [Psychromicrobium lacuslunae]|uniref:alpha/beta hydrolase n=1 Tax=Psychromicrobium lacuslunae TaxID=1618207 RepID=UPI00069627AA|nr:alpha/beta hydrolase-fold protein [Psychromicrobium lacuslunae]
MSRQPMRYRLSWLSVLAVTFLALAVSGCTAVNANSLDQQLKDAPFLNAADFNSAHNGITVLSAAKIGAHSFDLHVSTAAVADGATSEGNGIRITLPLGYQPTRHYPVLYLLAGTSPDSSYQDWFNKADIESILGDREQIVVMPDDGIAGWYTDWSAPSELAQNWQHYHLDQLVPWVDSHLSTLAERSGRTVAGASAGGYGAIRYAEERPELFSFAISISGALDLGLPALRQLIQDESKHLTGNPNMIFGDGSSTSEAQWQAHDPLTKLGALKATKIALYAGQGSPGTDYNDAQQLEWQLKQSGKAFSERASQLGVQLVNELGKALPGCDGGHNWACWSAALRELLPELDHQTL